MRADLFRSIGQFRSTIVSYPSIFYFTGDEIKRLLTFTRALSAQCASYQHYEIVEGIFTITSDIAIMLVGMPVLISVRLPRRQKVALLVLFGLGIFAIISAVLTKVYCLVPELISYVYMRWYYREATVMMLVVNMPLTWSLVGSMFPRLRSWFSNHGSSEIDFFSGGQIRSRARGMSTGEPRARESGIRQQFSLKPLGRRDRPSISINSSQERINRSNPEEQFENGIRKDVTVVLEAGEVGSWVEPETAEVGKAGDKTITTITAGR